jgi:hypothetical protein
MKERIWDLLQPSNTLEEMLVQDFIENWWRRERIRSAEATELRTRAWLLGLRMLLSDEGLEKLRYRLYLLCGKYAEAVRSQTSADLRDIMNELEDVRQELVVTGNGVGSLLEELESVLKEVKHWDPWPSTRNLSAWA